MKHLALLIVLLAGLGVFVHFWSKASKERREVLARIDRERSLRPGYSPTAELFREVGAPPVSHDAEAFTAPVPPAPPLATAASAPTAAPVPPAPPAPSAPLVFAVPVSAVVSAAAAPSASAPSASAVRELPTLFEAITVPGDFVPVEPATATRAVFAVERSAASVRSELDSVLAAVNLSAVWHEPTVASVTAGLASGLVTIYPNAGTVRDLDGRPLFPTARADETVIRLSTS